MNHAAHLTYSAFSMKIWSFSCKAKYARLRTHCGRRVRFRSSSGWNAALLPRFLARFWPWPFSFSPMAGIDTSQPMSKITLRRMLPLEHRYYIKNPLRVRRWNFGKLRGRGGGVSAACDSCRKAVAAPSRWSRVR